ncbi:glycosyltransferase [Salipaludibacillus sp. CUR1]|uniref:MGDG synthase family glycosyltransferase n=1 Tax=Salipaludibacillus sp. CUR1 TaxID=2820003 RepID=UPI001E3EA63F|nr:glycosyltransferase [Salipaludibacillus sp. CUR1]MCE7793283.1 glycosyltransferase [Salipaludibacillus sp. CUR1]
MEGQPLIFSASIGNGHNQAAKALQEELLIKGLNAEVVDTFHAIHPYLHHFVLHSYLRLLKISPGVWRKMYFYAEDYPLFLLLDQFGSLFVDQLYAMVQERACPFMISTHPFVTAFLSKLKQKKQIKAPLYTVITDFVLHPAYLRQEIDGYFTASHKVDEFAAMHQVSPDSFFSTGIPILKNHCLQTPKAAAREQLRLDKNIKTLLIAGGGMGLTNYVNILKALETLPEPVQILCMVGHNQGVKQRIINQKSKHKVKVIGFTDQFLLYLRASDGLISKAGGVTMAEALACEIPIVIFSTVPGHEEHNSDYLTSAGAAIRTTRYKELPQMIEKVLYEASMYETLKSGARLLKKPEATSHIIQEILAR